MIETITNHYRYPLSIVGSLAAVAIQRGFNSELGALPLPPTDPNTPPDVLSLAAWPRNTREQRGSRSNGVKRCSGRSWARWPRLRSNEASIPIVGRSPCPPQTLIPPQMSSRSPLGAKHPRTVQWASRSNGESNWTCVTLLHILTSYLNRKEKCQLDISTPRAHASRV
jgi:hypothetical protein